MAEETFPNWLELPRDITASILMRLGPVEILTNAQRVCTQWHSISMDPSLWTTIDMRDTGYIREIIEEADGGEVCHEKHCNAVANRLCTRAVDRSCGGLVELSIAHFLTDELLRHITASCNGIKRLRLVSCYGATKGGLCQAAAKLPLLEDLELSFVESSGEALEAIGNNCPRLKSLKFNSEVMGCPGFRMASDNEALTIADAMPGLRRLQLLGNRLSNAGLDAILGGCPHLEYLDLRKCLYVDLTGELGKRCAERIKDLRRPSDPTDDFEYLAELLGDDYEYNSDDDSQLGLSDIDMVTLTDADDDDHYDSSGSDYDSDSGSSSGYEDLDGDY